MTLDKSNLPERWYRADATDMSIEAFEAVADTGITIITSDGRSYVKSTYDTFCTQSWDGAVLFLARKQQGRVHDAERKLSESTAEYQRILHLKEPIKIC